MPFADVRRAITRGTPPGRAVVERQTTHVHDITAAELDTEYSESKARAQVSGSRTMLAAPLLREGVSIGAITIRRTEVRPFSEKQIKLLETFASQAVIAIENVRLFNELKESLEQQTATSEILGVIASSPTDIQPVLDAITKSAAQLCEATDASLYRAEDNVMRHVARHGYSTASRIGETRPITRGLMSGRVMIDGQTLH